MLFHVKIGVLLLKNDVFENFTFFLATFLKSFWFVVYNSKTNKNFKKTLQIKYNFRPLSKLFNSMTFFIGPILLTKTKKIHHCKNNTLLLNSKILLSSVSKNPISPYDFTKLDKKGKKKISLETIL